MSTLPPVSVGRAETDDVAASLAIMADSILGGYFEPEMARTLLAQAQHEGHLVVAKQEGRVLGFYVEAPQGSFLVFPYLHLLAVKTSERGRGIGTLLLRHLEDAELQAPGYPFRPKIFLLTAQENAGALRFYERHGYQSLAVIPHMFAEDDTEVLLMKDLGSKPGA